MANYNNNPRYAQPLMNDRRGPRFNTPSNRNAPRHTLNQFRPSTPASNSTPPLRTPKPPSESSTSTSTPPVESNPNQNNASTAAPIAPVEAAPNSVTVTDTSSNARPASEQRPIATSAPKRPFPTDPSTVPKSSQGGRSRLFIGNVPTDLTQDEFQVLFNKYGELVEYYINPSRGFGFVKLTSKQLAEQAKQDLDGYILRGKPLRIRFASQGAVVKVKNLSANVSNELLKDAFEQYFGGVERAVVIVDDRGKSIGEGIVEFEKKPAAQKCLNECTEGCFFITGELRPVIVEAWETKDEEDGLPEKLLVRNDAYFKERDLKPRFAEFNTIEHTIGLKWKQLELQEKQLIEEAKRRTQFAAEQLQAEVDQMVLEHHAQALREELTRRQEDLRRLDELRSQDFDRRRLAPSSMHLADTYNGPLGNAFASNQNVGGYPYNNDFSQAAYPNPLMQQTGSPAFNQGAHGFASPGDSNAFAHGNGYNHPAQDFERKRSRYH